MYTQSDTTNLFKNTFGSHHTRRRITVFIDILIEYELGFGKIGRKAPTQWTVNGNPYNDNGGRGDDNTHNTTSSPPQRPRVMIYA